MPTIRANGLEIGYDVHGAGPPLVLLHGATSLGREDYAAQGETATIRRVTTRAGIPTKELFTLFPKKPAKKMAYIAGLPKPHGCV